MIIIKLYIINLLRLIIKKAHIYIEMYIVEFFKTYKVTNKYSIFKKSDLFNSQYQNLEFNQIKRTFSRIKKI